ncbi:MAG: hypothetical protein V2J20_07370 [Wenzhouxiangella sp.]|jgi:hypothetical protein|nr:hypothetical protein [Wenzhouxiangella sp.]
MRSILIIGAALMICIQANAQHRSNNLVCADVSGIAPQIGVRFDQDVMPIFEESTLGCLNCHNASSTLRLDQGEQTHSNLFCEATRGSIPATSGKLVVPGQPEQSWLYLRVACEDPDNASFRMPRNGETLFLDELRVIYDWIRQGALSAETIFQSRFQLPDGC